MSARISIVTPSYNQGRYIERAIESVLSQQVDGLEYLVIDGGSTDDTLAILRKYGNRFYWTSERDQGPSDAINKGIERSIAPVIGWLNSDDIYYPGALAAVLKYFDSHPHIDVVYGDANHIDDLDVIIEKYPTEPWNWEHLKERCYISQPAAFMRRSVFIRFGGLDLSFRTMDYEYWIRLGQAGAIFDYMPVLLAATRLHKEAFTVSSRVRTHLDVNRLMVRHFGKVPDQWIFHYAHAVAEAFGFRRTDRFRFALAVSVLSMYASVRWNRGISMTVARTTAFWVGANARNSLKERLAR